MKRIVAAVLAGTMIFSQADLIVANAENTVSSVEENSESGQSDDQSTGESSTTDGGQEEGTPSETGSSENNENSTETEQPQEQEPAASGETGEQNTEGSGTTGEETTGNEGESGNSGESNAPAENSEEAGQAGETENSGSEASQETGEESGTQASEEAETPTTGNEESEAANESSAESEDATTVQPEEQNTDNTTSEETQTPEEQSQEAQPEVEDISEPDLEETDLDELIDDLDLELPEEEEEDDEGEEIDFSKEIDGGAVSIYAASDVFPKGTTVEVKKISKVRNKAVTDIVAEDIDDAIIACDTYDITFYDADHKKVQPGEDSSVEVRFTMSDTMMEKYMGSAGASVSVVHIDDKLNTQDMDKDIEYLNKNDEEIDIDDVDFGDGGLSPMALNGSASIDKIDIVVDATSFSAYAIVLAAGSIDLTPYTSGYTIDFTKSPGLTQETFSQYVQEAFNKSKEDKDNMYTIILPPGEWNLDKRAFLVGSNTTIDMTKGTKINYLGVVPDMITCNGEGDYGNSGYTMYKNIIFKGGTWDGKGSVLKGKNASCMMRFAHITNLEFDGVTFLDSNDGHHIEICAADGVTFKNCTFKGTYNGGHSHESIELDPSHNEDVFVWYYGTYDDLCCKNVTVTECTFEDLVRGIGTHHTVVGKTYDNITITNCTFNNMVAGCVLAKSWKNVTITDNVMNNAASGVDFRIVEGLLEYPNGKSSKNKIELGYDSNSVIKNNQITVGAGVDEDDYTYGIRVGGFTVKKGSNGLPKGEYKVNGFTIENNTITGQARMGISVMNCDSATIQNNNVSRLTGYQSYGIYVSNSSGLTISDNIFEYVKHTLIYLTNNSTAENIISNTLAGGNLGISNGKKSNIKNLENNKIYGAEKIAIGVYSGSTIASAKNNIIASAIGSAKKKSVYIAKDCKAAIFGHGSITMGVGEKYSVKAYVRSGKKATPKSSKKKVVSASKLVLTAKKKGKSTITLKDSKNKSTIGVVVKKKPTSVTVPLDSDKVELSVGEVFLLEPQVNEGAGCAGFTYKSSNKGVVSVTDQGVLVAKGKGSAVITVKTYNKKKTTVEVVVQ